MILELLKIMLFASAAAVLGGYLYMKTEAALKKKPRSKKNPKVLRTIVPFDYTGKNYNDWIQYIQYMNDVSDVINDRDTPVTRELTARLEAENIFKINK